MATANYGAGRSPSSAVVRILPNGRVFVGIGTQDLGTGTYTILAQAAAARSRHGPLARRRQTRRHHPAPLRRLRRLNHRRLRLPRRLRRRHRRPNSNSPNSPSPTPNRPSTEPTAEDIDTKDGKLFLKSAPDKSETITALIARNGGTPIEATATSELAKDRDTFTSHSWGAVFAEVAVDADTHMVQVRRVVATYDIGTLINQKTGINQLVGGIVWGISMALHEEALIDTKYGRTVNENFADYHVPVNADVDEIDVTCLNIPDYKFNPLGARGIGEIGITGAAAAIANAIYNATGKRVRDLPITLDKLMRPDPHRNAQTFCISIPQRSEGIRFQQRHNPTAAPITGCPIFATASSSLRWAKRHQTSRRPPNPHPLPKNVISTEAAQPHRAAQWRDPCICFCALPLLLFLPLPLGTPRLQPGPHTKQGASAPGVCSL